MPRNYKPVIGGRQNRQYTEHDLELALEEAQKHSLSIRKISEKYGIPRNTLQQRLLGNRLLKYGEQTVLSETTEKAIVDALLLCGQSEVKTINQFKNYLFRTLDKSIASEVM